MLKATEKTVYHSLLRILICVFALLLVFDSGLLVDSTSALSDQTQRYMASVVGVSVGVAPTEVNQLTARITELESELEAKERLIAVSVRDNNQKPAFDKSTFLLSIILFILLVLIVLNYALDYLRQRRPTILYNENKTELA